MEAISRYCLIRVIFWVVFRRLSVLLLANFHFHFDIFALFEPLFATFPCTLFSGKPFYYRDEGEAEGSKQNFLFRFCGFKLPDCIFVSALVRDFGYCFVVHTLPIDCSFLKYVSFDGFLKLLKIFWRSLKTRRDFLVVFIVYDSKRLLVRSMLLLLPGGNVLILAFDRDL